MPISSAIRRTALVAGALLAVPVAVAVVSLATELPAAANTCTARVPGDVNGDGLSDLLIGQPTRPQDGAFGALSVIRGAAGGGLSTSGSQLITDASLGLTALDPTEDFGQFAATGFFDGDCYADAVIGVTSEANPSVGAVVEVRGGPNGLDPTTAVRFTASQFAGGTQDFGGSLAVGDFNHDGYDDVAIGALGANGAEGGVGVLYGSSTGLTLTGHQWFTQDSPGVPGTAMVNNQFGRSVAAADFNGDGYADLAVGVPGEGVTRSVDAGSVVVLPGSAAGLTGTGSTIWSEDTEGVPGTAEDNDEFGFAVAAGDVTGDGYPDLVVGVIDERDQGAFGAVFLLRGSPSGITATGSQYRDQHSTGFPASPVLEGYGSTLAVGDFNGDGRADIASGAGDTPANGHSEAGAFAVLYGTSSGLSTTGSVLFTQATTGMPGAAQNGALFGIGLRTLPVTGTGYAGLVAPAPDHDSSGGVDNGGFDVMLGGGSGLTTTGARFLDGGDVVGGVVSKAQMGYDQAPALSTIA